MTGQVLALMLAGHLIGDWVVQTDAQALGKTTRWRSMAGHILTYHLVLAVFVLPVWHDRWTALGFAISAASHAFIDRRWPVRALLHRTGSPQFAEQMWGVLAADQALHIAILATITATLT